jgi:hypothetical protein
VHGLNPDRGYSAKLSGLPCAAGRKASWATAWWPGPAAKAGRVLRRGVRAGAWSPRTAHARDGAVTVEPVASSWRQGATGELKGTTRRASGKEGADGAHRGGGAMTGRRDGSVQRRAMGSSPEGGSAVTPAISWSCGGGRER